MFEIKLYRNTHIFDPIKPEVQWEDKDLTPAQALVWRQFGLIGHMLSHTKSRTPQELYGEVAMYERDFNPERQAKCASEFEPAAFMRGLAALIDVNLVRVEIQQDRYASVPAHG